MNIFKKKKVYHWPPIEDEQPNQVRQIITQIRQSYPDLKWTRLFVHHPGVDNDGIWFFWLPEKEGEVTIESSFGICPFLVETDKHNECFTSQSILETAEKVIEWLAFADGHDESFWHPR